MPSHGSVAYYEVAAQVIPLVFLAIVVEYRAFRFEPEERPSWLTEWYPALDAAGLRRRGPYQLRHTFATEALAAGISIFELARVMGASVKTIDRHHGHLARDSEQAIRARLDARRHALDVERERARDTKEKADS
jgi:integrase